MQINIALAHKVLQFKTIIITIKHWISTDMNSRLVNWDENMNALRIQLSGRIEYESKK